MFKETQDKKNTEYLQSLLNKISLENLKKDYCEEFLSEEKISKKYNMTKCGIKKLINEFNITRDTHAMKSKSNSEVKNRYYLEIKDKITKDIINDYYIKQDHGYYESIKYFNISEWIFDRLLNDYGIKKDRSLSFQKGYNSRVEKYGKENVNNWKKGHNTRIENCGSLEASYKEGYQRQIDTMVERYGVKCSFLKDGGLEGKKKHSGPNEKFERLLNLNNIEHEREFVLDFKSYDFKVEDKLIEINPLVTHNINFNPFNKAQNYKGIDKDYHLKKTLLAKQNNFSCIHIWPWENEDHIIDLLLPREKVFARKCTLKEVGLGESKTFINKYHIQGYARSKIKIGLYYNSELISIMTFGKPRYNKKYEYELIRYCSSKNVVGGAQKIFKYFISNYNVNSVISYCDNSKFSGRVYLDLGFKLINKGTPTRHWCNLKLEHYTDAFIRQNGFSRIIHHCDAKDDTLDTNNNYILMRRENFLEVFDCGQSTYIWQKENA